MLVVTMHSASRFSYQITGNCFLSKNIAELAAEAVRFLSTAAKALSRLSP
jgi:hypothetical protein